MDRLASRTGNPDTGFGMKTSTDDSTNLGVGLLGMRERARWLGGSVDFASGASGTTVLVRLPLDQNAATSSCDMRLGPATGAA
jgi:signal transduction histidine kinase